MDDDYPELPDYVRELLKSPEPVDEIRLDAEGNWLHDGVPFTNERIIDFFNRSVDITREGTHVVHYGNFVYPITVDDAPVFVSGVTVEGFGAMETIRLTLSNGTEEVLDIHSLHYRVERGLYCYIRGGRLLAKFRRSPSFQILERLEENDDIFYLTLRGEKIVLSEKTG